MPRKVPKAIKRPDKLDEVVGPAPGNETAAVLLGMWMREMYQWAQEARMDIIRLEVKTGLPKGDPGDPPEPPWE